MPTRGFDSMMNVMTYMKGKGFKTIHHMALVMIIQRLVGMKPSVVTHYIKKLIEFNFITELEEHKYRVNYDVAWEMDLE